MTWNGLNDYDNPIAFDLETTGVDVNEDRIVQIALDINGETHIATLNPEMPIPAEASAVHGITDEMVLKCKTFRDIAPKLYTTLMKADALVGYNIKGFDVPILMQEFERCGIDWHPTKLIDVFAIHKRLFPRTLEGLYKQYCGEPLEGAHDAGVDVRATLQVLEGIVRIFPEPLTREAFEELSSADGEIDLEGKMKRRDDGVAVFTIGKYKGWPVLHIVNTDEGYIRWMRKSFSVAFRRALDSEIQAAASPVLPLNNN